MHMYMNFVFDKYEEKGYVLLPIRLAELGYL